MKKNIVLLMAVASVSACSTGAPIVPEKSQEVIVQEPAIVPPGVVRMCWEEPIVQFEHNGPGLDSDGRWYHPDHYAVREVRQGKWRPCRPVVSETKGEARNEPIK